MHTESESLVVVFSCRPMSHDSSAGLAARYTMHIGGVSGQPYMPPPVGNWPIYPQMTMSPVNPVTSMAGGIDPLLASQFSHMHINTVMPSVSR